MKKKKNIELMKQVHNKQEIRDINNYKRVVVSMNTGTIAFRSPKDYDRNREKRNTQRMLSEY